MLVVGARPQFIKSAPVIREILLNHKKIRLSVVHSGQHYDAEMSEIFFHEFRLPAPTMHLHSGSGSHAVQTAIMMKRLEGCILHEKPDVVLVPGDTNTTLAASVTASKLGIRVAHIEAGLRSGDMTMPEEINRRLTDHVSTLLFAPTRTAVRNLRREGLAKMVHLTGDTMVDALNAMISQVERKQDTVLAEFEARAKEYVLVTLHRPSNVDDLGRLRKIHLALQKVATRMQVIFPVHPRTRARLAKLRVLRNDTKAGVRLAEPQGYIGILCLLRNAACLLTDSGGMQKESFLLHVPCITLRSTTEWPETLSQGANRLVPEPEKIPQALLMARFSEGLGWGILGVRNPFGDGNASRRIANIIERMPLE